MLDRGDRALLRGDRCRAGLAIRRGQDQRAEVIRRMHRRSASSSVKNGIGCGDGREGHRVLREDDVAPVDEFQFGETRLAHEAPRSQVLIAG